MGKNLLLILVTLCATGLLPLHSQEPAQKPSGFVTAHIVLYQPNDVLEARMPSAPELANYVQQLQSTLIARYQGTKTAQTLYVVVGIRPGNKSKVWLMAFPATSASKELDDLRKQLEAVPPVSVKGQVALALCGKINGGDPAVVEKVPFQPPIPQEWRDALKGKSVEAQVVPDVYMDATWPNN